MRLGLTYDLQTDPQDERQAEFDPPHVLDALSDALTSLGCQVTRLGNADALRKQLAAVKQLDLVFNIAEGGWGASREAWVPTLLEFWKVPYVGSDALALSLGLDKLMCKRLAMAEGIETPSWVAVAHPDEVPVPFPLEFPVIVKPRYQGSGRGIDRGAVVETLPALQQRVAWLFERCREPMLIEEFIPFGELTVCMIGNDPAIAYPAIQRPIDAATRLSYHVARDPSAVWEASVTLDPVIDAKARRMATRMFKTLGCRDMARIDCRVDDHGELWFLEINPLPSFDPEGSFGLLAESLGTTYQAMVGAVMHAALVRLGLPVPWAMKDSARTFLI